MTRAQLGAFLTLTCNGTVAQDGDGVQWDRGVHSPNLQLDGGSRRRWRNGTGAQLGASLTLTLMGRGLKTETGVQSDMGAIRGVPTLTYSGSRWRRGRNETAVQLGASVALTCNGTVAQDGDEGAMGQRCN